MNHNTFQSEYTLSNKNNEDLNKHIFNRNTMLSSLVSKPNTNPHYFNEQHNENRESAETIFNKRFANLNNDAPASGKLGYVNFSSETNSNQPINFNGDYSTYINSISDRELINRPSSENKQDKR